MVKSKFYTNASSIQNEYETKKYLAVYLEVFGTTHMSDFNHQNRVKMDYKLLFSRFRTFGPLISRINHIKMHLQMPTSSSIAARPV